MMPVKILHPDVRVSELLHIADEIKKRKDKRPAAAFYFKQVKKMINAKMHQCQK